MTTSLENRKQLHRVEHLLHFFYHQSCTFFVQLAHHFLSSTYGLYCATFPEHKASSRYIIALQWEMRSGRWLRAHALGCVISQRSEIC